MKRYYDILGLDETKDKKAIKKAYAKMVKQYRPEKEPVKFQEVRDAYDNILDYLSKEIEDKDNEFNSGVEEKSNIKKTKAINTVSTAFEEENYIEKAKQYANEKKYEKAIDMYEKALEELQNNTNIINEIGVLYYAKGDVDKAISQFLKAISIDSSSDITYNNLAQLYMKCREYDLARKNFEEAYKIDQKPRYVKGILNTYKFSKKGSELLNAITQYDFDKEESVAYYIECIKFAVEKYANSSDEKDKNILEDILNKISNVFIDTEYALDVCDGIYKIGTMLFDKEHYEIAEILVKYGIHIYKSSEINHLNSKILKHYKDEEERVEIEGITYDTRIHPDIVSLVIALSNNSNSKVVQNLLSYMEDIHIKDFVRDVEIIKLEYKILFEKNKDLLERIEKDKKTKSKQVKIVYLVGLVLILLIILKLLKG